MNETLKDYEPSDRLGGNLQLPADETLKDYGPSDRFGGSLQLPADGTLKDYEPSDRFGGSLQLPADGELFEGDIMMDKRFRDVIMNGESKKSSLKVT